MKTINLIEIAKAKKTLKEIEFECRTWETEFVRNHAVWEQIAMELNSNLTRQEKKFWSLVMDLYHYKYSEGKGVSKYLLPYLN
jgi:hypothetical protein